MPERVYMKESDEALVNGTYEQYEEGETYEVPGWVGRTFKRKGTAVNAASDEAQFDPTGERETKPSPTEAEQKRVTAEPTTEGSAWYQFRDESGELITDDGDVLKVHGKDDRDALLDELND